MQYEDMKFSLQKMVCIYYIIIETKSIIMYESLNIVNLFIATLQLIVKDTPSFELY